MENEKKNHHIFKKILILVIVLSAFELAEKVVDGAFELEKINVQKQQTTTQASEQITYTVEGGN